MMKQPCACKVERREPNAAVDAPYFPGIRRFPSTWIVEVSADCLEHGYMTHPDFHPAADLRYGD